MVVDDELDIAENTSEYFNMFDVPTAYATSYEEALAFLDTHTIDLILLDINLGTKSGFELCKKIRETLEIPIFFISARNSDDDVLTALNIGGDDYIKKPYTLNILLAKVKAMLKRYESLRNIKTVEANEQYVLGEEKVDERIILDHNYHQVKILGEVRKLKEMEYQLLKYLIAHANKVVTKEELLENVWRNIYVQEGTLSVHIRHLREKIEEQPNAPTYIKTVWGIGYVFEL